MAEHEFDRRTTRDYYRRVLTDIEAMIYRLSRWESMDAEQIRNMVVLLRSMVLIERELLDLSDRWDRFGQEAPEVLDFETDLRLMLDAEGTTTEETP